jgi:hypothetical protein
MPLIFLKNKYKRNKNFRRLNELNPKHFYLLTLIVPARSKVPVVIFMK